MNLYWSKPYILFHNIIYKPLLQAICSFTANNFRICMGYNIAKVGDTMEEKDFSLRLAQLREKKGVSARDMSLSIGQNPGYINNIESGKSMPSLSGFFYICDYLGITPSAFFDLDSHNPSRLNAVISRMKKLDEKQLETVDALLKYIVKE